MEKPGPTVLKSSGETQSFSKTKLQAFLQKLAYNLSDHVKIGMIADKVELGLTNNMKTSDLNPLVSETSAYLNVLHPDYSILAARVAMAGLHKTTHSSILEYANNIYKFIDKGGRDCKLLADDVYQVFIDHAEALQSIVDYTRDFEYDYFGLKTLERSYLLRVNREVAERPQQMLLRVCIGIHGDNIESIKESYELMSTKWFTHATPTLFNAGTPFPQMSSCFLLSMSGDSIDGIYDTLKRCALISKSAGGIGLSVTCIRAQGSYIRGTNGISNGLVPMLRVFDATARYVDQGGGKRKGSFAMYLEPWHADVFDFLQLRKNHGKEELRARDLFYALWTPDLFMQRVEQDADWTLMCPAECPGLQDSYGKAFEELYTGYEKAGKGRKTIKARFLWNEIIQAQIETGTPYMLYKDACNEKSNQKNLGTIKCSNLCTEIVEYTSDDEVAVCNLASIALPRFVDEVAKTYNFDKLIEVTRVIVRNLNKIIDRNYYPVKEARKSNISHRPIGIGVQGLADAFALLRLDYDSPEALELNNRIFETIYYAACLESCEIAKKEGPYSTFNGSPASQGLLQFDLWGVTPTMYDWKSLKDDIVKNGMRNSLLLAPMPTASTSQILGNNETFEAFTSNIYSRRVLSGEFICVNKYLIKDLIELGLWDDDLRNRLLASNGSIQHVNTIPEKIRSLYRTVWEISQKAVIELAAGRGPFIDQSQSLNIHLKEPDFNRISSMHFYGWKKGLKTGMYYLRSRPAANAIKFTVDVGTVLQTNKELKEANSKENGEVKMNGKRDADAFEQNELKACPLRKKKVKTDGTVEDDDECFACGS